MVVLHHQFEVRRMLPTREGRDLGALQGLPKLHESTTQCIPRTFAASSHCLRLGSRLLRCRFRGAKKLLANLVGMLLEEAVEHDSVSIVVRPLQPLVGIFVGTGRDVFLNSS